MKRKFLIFAMFLFAFSVGYAVNGNEEFLKGHNFLEQKKYKEAEKYFIMIKGILKRQNTTF